MYIAEKMKFAYQTIRVKKNQKAARPINSKYIACH